MLKSLIPVVVLVALITGCSKTYITPSSTPTTDTVTRTSKDIIEFRANGNANIVRVRYSDAQDGLSQLNTVLPFNTSIASTKDFIFLSLEATPLSYPYTIFSPFLNIQIFVNGELFKEASSSDWLLNTISVSGTFRH